MTGSRATAFGAVLPSGELGVDPAAVRVYATGAERLGLSHVAAYEHVLGADVTNRPDWSGPYTSANAFREPFVLFGYMAAVTTALGFATSVMVLPQRQTALVAKQAAELALLGGNRFRLGVGIGWNAVEYEALGVPWERRGARLEEQVELLRLLWTRETVDFAGAFHRVDAAGINPLPGVPVPLWLGGGAESDTALDRVARVADGWMAPQHDGVEAAPRIAWLRERCEAAGRDPAAMGVEGRVVLRQLGPDRGEWRRTLESWLAAGASHVSVATHGMGCRSVADHLELLEEARDLFPQADVSRS